MKGYSNETIAILKEINKRLKDDDISKYCSLITKQYQIYNLRVRRYTEKYKDLIVNRFNNSSIIDAIPISEKGKRKTPYANDTEEVAALCEAVKAYWNQINNLRYFSFLSEKNSNVVLVGPNGAGKTTLLRNLEKITGDDNIRFFQAERLLAYDQDFHSTENFAQLKNDTIQNFTNSSTLPKINPWNTIGNQFNYAISFFNVYRLREFEERDRHEIDKMQTNRIITIWNQLIKDRELYTDGEIKAQIPGKEPYGVADFSTGEKEILFFLIEILLLPEKPYYFIDEPEMNLNPSVASALWDDIEKERPNATFVYLTHDKDFALSRIDSRIYWIQRYEGEENWVFEPLPEVSDLPRSLVVSLVGNRRPVLFCESEDSSKYDYQLYQLLFPSFKIIPSGGCQQVIAHVKSYSLVGNQSKAFGIIDRDFREETFFQGEEDNGIFPLPFFEIEEFLLCPEILEYVINKTKKPDEDGATLLRRVEAKIIETFAKSKERWITQKAGFYLRTVYYNGPQKQFAQFSRLKQAYESFLDSIKLENIRGDNETLFNQIIQRNDYKEILRNYDNKGIVEMVSQLLGFPYGENALALLKTAEPTFLISLQTKYFPKIVE